MAERQYVTFFVDDHFLGIDIRLVREVLRRPVIVPVALTADYISGLLNLRGQLVTVIDLGIRLGLGPRTLTENTCCIVLKTAQEARRCLEGDAGSDRTAPDLVGLLVDRVGDVVPVQDEVIEPPPANVGQLEGRFFGGVAKLDDRLLVTQRVAELLDLEAVGYGARSLEAAQPVSGLLASGDDE